MDEIIEREFAALRALIAEKEARVDQAMRTEAAVVNERLTHVNQWREAMLENNSRLISRDELNALLVPFSQAVERAEKPNWTVISMLLSAILALSSAAWVMVGLRVEAAIAPIIQQQGALRVASDLNAAEIANIRHDLRPREYWETLSARLSVLEHNSK